MNVIRNFIWGIFIALPLGAYCQTDTLVLDDAACQQKALECNYDLRRQKNLQQAAEYQRKEVLAEFFPSAKAAGGVLYTPQFDVLSTSIMQMPLDLQMQMKGTYMANIQVTQPLFAGGQIVNGYKLTQVGEKAQTEQVRMVEGQAIAEVCNAYWTYVAVRSKLRMMEEYRIQMDSLLSTVSGSVELGMATDADLLKVQTAKYNVEYLYQQVQSGMELCRMALSNMLDIPYDKTYLLPADTDIQLIENKAESSSIADRPEIQLLQYQVDAKALMRKTTIGKYLPTLGVSAGYMWLGNIFMAGNVSTSFAPIAIDQNIRLDMPMVMGVLSVPITDWGKGAYAIKRAKIDEQNARLEQEKNTRLMTLEMQQARMNLINGWELVCASDVALQSATAALRVMRDRYELGMCTLTDLLSSQSDWQKAESDYIEARTQYKINETEYFRTTGKLNTSR